MMAGLGAGDFDRKIKVVRSVDQIDDCGKPISTDEQTVFEAWAKYVPISDGEKLTHKHQADLSARFTIRWSNAGAAAVASDRLIFEGRRFGIFGIKEIGRRQYLEITAGAHET